MTNMKDITEASKFYRKRYKVEICFKHLKNNGAFWNTLFLPLHLIHFFNHQLLVNELLTLNFNENLIKTTNHIV